MESRLTDINRSMPVGTDAVAAARRQVPHASVQATQATRATSDVSSAQAKTVQHQRPIDVHEAAKKLNEIVRNLRKDVHFAVDENTSVTVLKFFKSETGELIKQYPPEEVLAMMASIRKQTGFLYESMV